MFFYLLVKISILTGEVSVNRIAWAAPKEDKQTEYSHDKPLPITRKRSDTKGNVSQH
jgi:hypothetical protein